MNEPYRQCTAITRRRAFAVVAGGAVGALLPAARWADGPHLFEWTGTALGAPASIRLYHHDRRKAESAIAASVAEIERLENEFSLYRVDSALSRLNRDGRLEAPSHDMRRLLDLSRHFGDITDGAFDVTVQPLWELYARHFLRRANDDAGPPAEAVDDTLRCVDYRRINVTAEAVRLLPGMAVTLNGIAQGYITDRVADLLRMRGWSNVLVDLGEMRALDGHPNDRPWQIALRDSNGRSGPILPLANAALATSAPTGTTLDRLGRFGHLFNPRRGWHAPLHRNLTVLAGDATTADALSTALALAAPEDIPVLARRAGLGAVWRTDLSGRFAQLYG
jgi:thiamine biosynthesis lipoprotein